jgi:hypothetical protein
LTRIIPKTAKWTAISLWRKKARKIWSRVTAIPRRSRTPHPNVPNEGLECVEQALLSQFWSKLSTCLRFYVISDSPEIRYGGSRESLYSRIRELVFVRNGD